MALWGVFAIFVSSLSIYSPAEQTFDRNLPLIQWH
jgi:hypothetical protein